MSKGHLFSYYVPGRVVFNMGSMRYCLLTLSLFLSNPNWAQSDLAGLGHYRLGRTTLDTLNLTGFTEADQPYVKGTLTLPCTHIRVFRSATAALDGLPVTDLALYFHDNTLFKISGDYSAELRSYFVAKHGQGASQSPRRYQLCPQDRNKSVLMWAEAWTGGDVVGLIVHTKGYTTDCQLTEKAILSITSRRILALSSECDLHPTDPFTEEYINAQPDHQGKQR